MPTSQERTVVSSKGAKGVDDHRSLVSARQLLTSPVFRPTSRRHARVLREPSRGFRARLTYSKPIAAALFNCLSLTRTLRVSHINLKAAREVLISPMFRWRRCVRPYLHETIERHSEDRHRFGYPLPVLHLLGMRVAKLVYQRAVQVEYNGTILQFRPNCSATSSGRRTEVRPQPVASRSRAGRAD